MKIPKIIHRIWLDDGNQTPIPAEYEKLYDTFRRDYPDWEHRLWTDKDLPSSRERITSNMIENLPNVGMKADVFRVEIILAVGGMYVDTDVESKKNAEELLWPFTTYAFKQGAGLGNHVVGSIKDNKIFKEMLNHFMKPRIALKLVSATPHDTMEMTGPELLTRFLCSYNDGTLIERSAWSEYMIHHQAGLWWRGKYDSKEVKPKVLKPGHEGGCC